MPPDDGRRWVAWFRCPMMALPGGVIVDDTWLRVRNLLHAIATGIPPLLPLYPACTMGSQILIETTDRYVQLWIGQPQPPPEGVA